MTVDHPYSHVHTIIALNYLMPQYKKPSCGSSVANTPSVSTATAFCQLLTARHPPLCLPQQGEEWILLCHGVREQIIQPVFSSPNKTNCTYNHWEVTRHWTRGHRLFIPCPLIIPPASSSALITAGVERGSMASCFGLAVNLFDLLTPGLISHFLKSQKPCLKAAGQVLYFCSFCYCYLKACKPQHIKCESVVVWGSNF